VPALPGPVFGRPDDEDDAASVSSQSSLSSVSSEVAGPSRDARKKKKKLPAKQVRFFSNLPRLEIFMA
jgi:hypothetical protein